MEKQPYQKGDKVCIVSNDYLYGQPFHYFNVGQTVKVVDAHLIQTAGSVRCRDSNGLEQYVKLEHLAPPEKLNEKRKATP